MKNTILRRVAATGSAVVLTAGVVLSASAIDKSRFIAVEQNLASAHSLMEQYSENEKTLQEKIDDLRADAESKIDEANSAIKEKNNKIDTVKADLELANAEKVGLNKQIEYLNKQIADLEYVRNVVVGQVAYLDAVNSQLTAENTNLKTENAEKNTEITRLENELKKANDEIKWANDKIAELEASSAKLTEYEPASEEDINAIETTIDVEIQK